MKNIVAKRTLIEFWGNPKYRDSETSLKEWFDKVKKAQWETPQELKQQFGDASVITDKRVVFNIKVNKYRLVVDIEYSIQFVYIVWIGTHSEYDKIDVRELNYKP
ncbi:MAG: type II toxin-antitoxin system HigB family toxin [Bacteroidetes bacterium]|nr:type II toxin-antitoxin system HigB family toxin [Bacteroidota bacterium]